VSSSELKFEIGHVLFVDIVGYSKLLINEQSEQIQKLKEIVRGTDQVRLAEAEGKLLRLPTGDGGALVFRNNPEAPTLCAMEISKALKNHPELRIRMGIHSGPVNEISDLNEQANIAGAGINVAQRVMDCGDAGHILLSKRVADDLEQYPRWRSLLHDLGECEVKHGQKVSLVNFYDDEIGNRVLPAKIAALRSEQTTTSQVEEKRSRRNRRLVAGTFLAATAAAIVASIVAYRMSRQLIRDQLEKKAANLIPEKSVAVLPFENLSRDEENAFLATGIQDEILTRLAKVAALKVISRTSTKQYESKPGNLSDIAKQLGVATILEGNVQKVGGKVRVNVQLIKATTDAHLWAETYDRELIDVLAVESEVATEIASALRAALSPEEKARIDEKPTNNPEAYALYLRAREVLDQAADIRVEIERGAGLYKQAIALDPKFALAHAQLAIITTSLFLVFEPREAFKIKARTAAEESLRLKPELGEGHMALGFYLDYIDRNYDAAAREYEIARRVLPNDSVLIRRIGLMKRRQGHWREGLAEVERAASLDPRNLLSIGWLAGTYEDVHDWPTAEEMRQRCLAGALSDYPHETPAQEKFQLCFSHLLGTGDASLLQKAMAEVPADFDPGGTVTQFRYDAYIYLHDFDAAEKVLDRSPLTIFQSGSAPPVAKFFLQGRIAAARGDRTRAKLLFEAALPQAENEVKEHPETASRHAQLGIAYAYLGRKEDTLREGRRALALLPESKDAYYGVDITNMFAIICARLGDGDLAIPLIERLLRTPHGVVLQDLRSSPDWDPIRNDPRFQKILASPEPKVIYN
jgi:TolB-like protein/class 3 adenylate cyclase